MDKVLDYLKNYFKSKTVAYYIALGVAVLAFVGGIIVSGALGFAGASAGPALLVTFGLLIFIGASVFGHDKIGAAIVAGFSYAAFVETLVEVFSHFLNEIQAQAMVGLDLSNVEGLSTLIAGVIFLVVCAIAANVLAFIKLNKQEKKEVVETEVVTDEN